MLLLQGVVLFNSWTDIGRVVVSTAAIFLLVVAILRIAGAQAIAQMSGYDMVSTITLGSVVASVAVFREVALGEGVAALLTLIALQETVRFLQARWLVAHHAVRQQPMVLLWDGSLLEEQLRRHSISADEVRAAVRQAGLASFSDARVVVLENDGAWSVVPQSAPVGDDSALFGLPIPGGEANSPGQSGVPDTPASPLRVP